MFVLTKELDVLSSAKTWYINPILPCRVIDVDIALETTLTSGDSEITISDGTTDVAVLVITQTGSAVGDTRESLTFDSTSLGKVLFGPTVPIKITCDATPSQGKAQITLVLDEFHGA